MTERRAKLAVVRGLRVILPLLLLSSSAWADDASTTPAAAASVAPAAAETAPTTALVPAETAPADADVVAPATPDLPALAPPVATPIPDLAPAPPAAAKWLAPDPDDDGAPGRVRLAAMAAVYLLALGGWLVRDVAVSRGSAEIVRRGFYGALRVEREGRGTADEALKLLHGRIAHGLQLTDAARRMEPTTYFGPTSGVGLAIGRHPKRRRGEPLRVGVVGLGVGTLAAWSRPGDGFRFYELDPEVIRLSNDEPAVFTYLRDAPGATSVVPGDGRLSLEGEPPAGFDVLVLDAFSSDAIPTHLLTREAFDVYRRQLAPGGVLAVHVTNRYLDLKPVVRGVAASLGLRARHVPSFERGARWSSDWMLVAPDAAVLDDELVSAASLPPLGGRPDVVWTDDWSDLVSALKR
jgi:SAM-dependent methyltransferase